MEASIQAEWIPSAEGGLDGMEEVRRKARKDLGKGLYGANEQSHLKSLVKKPAMARVRAFNEITKSEGISNSILC